MPGGFFLPLQLNLLANGLVSFVCAMQVESFRKIEGNAYATTMCIGNLRSGMEHLYRWHVTREKAHLHRAKVYCLVILVFVLGASLGGVACRSMGRYTILICCLSASGGGRSDGMDPEAGKRRNIERSI